MPELIRLQTSDFEFSVWANDISQRASVYHTTAVSRARLTPEADREDNAAQLETADPAYVLRFSPKAELLDISLYPESQAGPDDLVTTVPSPEKCAELSLSAPLFFENTQYQFEWVFFGAVTHARLAHRSKSVCNAFRFARQRGPLPARLTGTINTGNDVGWLRLPLVFELNGQTHTQHIAFEVLPTKMALHQDLPAMYRAIDAVYPLWRFSLVEKTEQDAASSKQRGHFPLMWLANFTALRERFEQGLKVICAAPHSRLQPTLAHYKAARLKGRVPHKLAQQIKQDLANGQSDKRYRIEKKQLSVDTPENRFIKMAVSHSKRQLAEFEAKLRGSNQAPEHQRFSDSFLNELHSWQQPLQKMLHQSFLKEVGKHTGLSRESLVLQQKTGYSAVYRVWQELKFYLDIFGHQSSISMKSVAEIYEIWCFLCLKNMLEQDLGFTLVESNAARLELKDYFEYQLKDGLAGAFRFQREDGVAARLVHEPSFTTRGKEIRSYAVNQRPDIVLEVTLPKNSTFAEEKRFIWVFDAKYRIKTEKDRHDDSSQDITSTDYVPDDAINQMHRYRDALIRLSEQSSDLPKVPNGHVIKKSRPVFGAFALYPGFFDQANMPNPYASSIEEVGIGAFALLPSQVESGYCGHQWLLEFLQGQIGKAPEYPVTSMAEQFYVQEAARIPYSGMRQILYSDLTMTAALGGQRTRNNSYFEKFKQGTALWYHLPQITFLQKFKQHVAEEIRYLALASTSAVKNSTKQIDKLWPVKSVRLLPRYALTEEQAGKKSGSAELYYLFELGKPLTLQAPVTEVPHRPMKNSMKLTTLTRLEGVPSFDKVEKVYKEAMV
ncbi:restriction endonuclease-like protein [Oceanimonas sp. CAM02]|uniref:restriction endonuclease-like protein n=1 Tax=Oceanimonas sp. CAM02 TaxID=3080336 RepID=UPI0029358F50|nr:restriction endonuclease-like protein [Oceanimonas sp. CAM02]MDV2857721.1 restriction endonuclease-like protein [Oceanimonas sp. CAM02]